MRANISDELLNAINEKIYLDLELHVLNLRFTKAEQEGKNGFANHINKIISDVIKQRKSVSDYLKQNNVKVFEAEEIDDMFVEYKYYQKLDGGYKEGSQRFWRDAIKLQLKRRINKYFAGGD